MDPIGEVGVQEWSESASRAHAGGLMGGHFMGRGQN